MLMKDKEDLQKGPAYFFQELYDKIVILREWEFNSNGSEGSVGDWSDRGGDVALPGHKPWFCYWNNTALEGFIYIYHSVNGSGSSSDNAAAESTPTETGSSYQLRQATGLPFPKVLKLEERRGPRRLPSACQQKQILYDGTAASLPEDDESPTSINLDEREPAPPQKGVFDPGRSELEERQQHHRMGPFLASACQCQWVNE